MINPELWLSRFGDYLQLRRYTERTVEGQLGTVRQFLEYLEGQKLQSLSELTREVLEGYRHHLFKSRYRGRRLTLRTQQSKLSAVRNFTRYLARERYLLLDPGADFEMPRAQPPAPRVVLSEREVRTLLDYPDTVTPLGLRDRAILELLYSSALRNSELLGLNLTELDLERREVRVLRGKGDKSRVVPLGEEAARWTAAYIERGRPALDGGQGGLRVFLSSRGKPLVRANLAHMTRRTAVRAGLSKTVTPHVLRHSCATHMLRRGAGLRHLQELLGHASPSTTQRYTKVEISDLQRVHRRYHPRERRAQG